VITEDAVPVVWRLWIGLLAGDVLALGILRGRYGLRVSDMLGFRREGVVDLIKAGAPSSAIRCGRASRRWGRPRAAAARRSRRR
jgi:hypothetical protein